MGKDPCKGQTGGLRPGRKRGKETYDIRWSLGKPHASQASPSLGRGREGIPLQLRSCLVSSALGRPWMGLGGESWPVLTSSAASPGCPGKPLFPGTPCSQKEAQVSSLLPLARGAPCFIPTPKIEYATFCHQPVLLQARLHQA